MLKAIVYDYDGTLTDDPMPQFKILELSGMKGGAQSPEFMALVKKVMTQQKVTVYEAMIEVILDTVRDAGFQLIDGNIGMGANERRYNPGVQGFLKNLKDRGVRNYLLSSGSKAYLEQTEIAPYFEAIYASTLAYDSNGEVVGIEHVMTDAEKPVALQEIAMAINGSPDDFDGILYMGDGPTDVPAMKYVKGHGGKTVLFQPKDSKPWADTSMIDFVSSPDFKEGNELSNYIEGLLAA